MNKKLAIIPARSGSKGVPNKNIYNFYGVPLLGWAIIFAKQSKLFDKIVVSTDSEEYAQIAIDYGASVPYLRPKEIAADKSNIVDTVENLILSLDDSYQYVSLLEPTSPLRRINDLLSCYKYIQDDKIDSVFTVSPVDIRFHPDKQFFVDKNNQASFASYNGTNIVNRQELNLSYIKNGVSYFFKPKPFLKDRKILCGNIKAHILDRELVNIDSFNDLHELKEFELKNPPVDYMMSYLDKM